MTKTNIFGSSKLVRHSRLVRYSNLIGISIVILLFSTIVLADEEIDALNKIKDNAIKERAAAITEILTKVDFHMNQAKEGVKARNQEKVDQNIKAANDTLRTLTAHLDPNNPNDKLILDRIAKLDQQLTNIKNADPGDTIDQPETGDDLEVSSPNKLWLMLIPLGILIMIGLYKTKRYKIDKKGKPEYFDKKIYDLIKKVIELLKYVRDNSMLDSYYSFIPSDKKTRFDETIGKIMTEAKHRHLSRGWTDNLFHRKKRIKAIEDLVNGFGHITDPAKKTQLIEILKLSTEYLTEAKSLITTFAKTGLAMRKKRFEELDSRVNDLIEKASRYGFT